MSVRDDRGSATVWVVAVAIVLWSSMTVVVLIGVAIGARHRAAAAADLAALAAAAAPRRECAAAEAIALANDASVVACSVAGSVVEVTASVRVPGLAHLALGSVSASARAGPS